MPDPTTLKALWEQELTDATDALAEAKSALHDALSGEGELRTALTRSLRAATARREAIAALWERAAASDTPAEGAAVMDEVRRELVALQEDEARALGDERGLADAKAEARRLRVVVKRSAARFAAAREEIDAVIAAHEERQALVAAAVSAPLDGVPTAAEAYLDAPAYAALKASVEAAIPELLRTAAASRLELASLRTSHAVELADFTLVELGDHWTATGGAAEAADTAALALDDAEAALAAWVGSAAERLERATATLDGLDLAIDAAEAAAVATVPAGAAAAVAAEVEALEAQADVEIRMLQLEKSRTQRDAEPTGARKAAVTMARNRLADAEAVRDAKVAALIPQKAVIDRWQAELSEESWLAYLDFVEHSAVLAELEDADPAALAAAVTAAEAAATTALAEAWAATRGEEVWEEFVEEMEAREATALGVRRRRLVHAIRGDSFVPGLPPALP